MRIDNQDIVRTARELRDEENGKLHVRPLDLAPRPLPLAWLAAIPAAVVVGFVLGLWTQAYKQSETPLTALVDTIYIEVPTPEQPRRETKTESLPSAEKNAPKQTVRPSLAPRRPQHAIGRPVTDDHIRYDLLVRN